MKHLFITFLALIIFLNISFPQYGWQNVYNAAPTGFIDLYFTSENTGYVLGSTALYKTEDGGYSWSNIYTNATLNSMHFVNENTGFIAASGKILRTTNACLNWTEQYSSNFNYVDIIFSTNMTGICIGNRWVNSIPYCQIIRTIDGGNTWFLSWPYSNGYVLNTVSFLNANTFCVSGYMPNWSNFNVKTTNSGESWNSFNYNVPNLKKMFFTGINTGYGTTDTYYPLNRIYKSESGGNGWAVMNLSSKIPRGLFFVNSSTGYVVGDSGVIFHTSDAGFNWNEQVSGTYKRLTDVFFVNSNTGYICGNDFGNSGFILKTTNGGNPLGIQPISIEEPSVFSLSQNYPNPFNPSTKIKFDISGISITQTFLSVYDILGHEIAVLVNEQLCPGKYEIDFNASNYPSGVYYYKLQAGDFTEIKKMVLVK